MQYKSGYHSITVRTGVHVMEKGGEHRPKMGKLSRNSAQSAKVAGAAESFSGVGVPKSPREQGKMGQSARPVRLVFRARQLF